MSKYLVIGGSGMLGSDLVRELERRGEDWIAPSRADFNITDAMSIAELATGRFDGVTWCVNCAAYTAVDQAETEAGQATDLNQLSPAMLAKACRQAGIRLMHLSTDFVFDGEASQPYLETDKTNPIGTYGRTKRDGEESVLDANSDSIVVRTSWLFGQQGKSFPKSIITAYQAGRKLRVVDDQVGSPTYTADLVSVLLALCEMAAEGGIYQATGPDSMSWYEFARHIIMAWAPGKELEIEPISTAEYPTAAKRPKYSVLSNDKIQSLGISSMPSIGDAIRRYIELIRLANAV